MFADSNAGRSLQHRPFKAEALIKRGLLLHIVNSLLFRREIITFQPENTFSPIVLNFIFLPKTTIMETVSFELQPSIAARLDKYLKLFGSKDIMFSKFIDFHINRIKREIAQMQNDLNVYEQKYNMPSEEFYRKFSAGQTDDSSDYLIWAGIYEMQLSCKQKLQELI